MKKINKDVFANCKKLTHVNIANGSQLTYIGEGAFQNCEKLENMNFSSSLQFIGEKAFYQCKSLATIDLSSTNVKEISAQVFQGCTQLKTILLPNVVEIIGDYAFEYTALQSIALPVSVQRIGNYAFANIGTVINANLGMDSWIVSEYTLTDVQFANHSKLEYIGKYAFANAKIQTVTLPTQQDIFIDDYAFMNTALKEILLPNNVSVGEYILFGCQDIQTIGHHSQYLTQSFFGITIEYLPTNLTKVILNDGSTIISNYAFVGFNHLETVVIPDSVTMIGNNAFYGCGKLTSLNLQHVTYIGDNAFYACTNLETILFSEDLTFVGNVAFEGTKWLDNQNDIFVLLNGILIRYNGNERVVNLPDEVVQIAGGAFNNSYGVEEIIASEHLQKIHYGAFDNALSLKKLILNGNKIISIDAGVFDNVSDSFSVSVYDVNAYKADAYWYLYSDILKNK